MAKLMSDRALLDQIYNDYYATFCDFGDDNKTRSSKVYVPIDCVKLAQYFDIDEDIVFGRLYYHLDKKHGYIQSDGVQVPLFSIRSGTDRHVIHFPLLAAVLANMQESNFRFILPIVLSSTALVLSVASFLVSIS